MQLLISSFVGAVGAGINGMGRVAWGVAFDRLGFRTCIVACGVRYVIMNIHISKVCLSYNMFFIFTWCEVYRNMHQFSLS